LLFYHISSQKQKKEWDIPVENPIHLVTGKEQTTGRNIWKNQETKSQKVQEYINILTFSGDCTYNLNAKRRIVGQSFSGNISKISLIKEMSCFVLPTSYGLNFKHDNLCLTSPD